MVKIATTSDIEKAIMQRCKTELRMKDMFLSRLTNIVTLGRGGNYDAIPTKIDTMEIDASTTQMKLF